PDKPDVDAAHRGPWSPEIVVGTSIGAVNGAAIVQGISPDTMVEFWKQARESDIEGLPPGMNWLTRRIANVVLRALIGRPLRRVPHNDAHSPAEAFRDLPPRLVGRWSNLLDTGPLRQTMTEKLGLDEAQINASEQTLLISATDIRTGELAIFSNRNIQDRKLGSERANLQTGITFNRILASASIPMVYPWTHDGDSTYWDGAVVANTPLSAALDAARDRPITEDMEVIVVLMTPWRKGEIGHQRLPESFLEAATWTLDWALLASFRDRLRVTDAYNKLARIEREMNPNSATYQYRLVNVVVVAPDDFFPIARIVDYDDHSQDLIDMGYHAAKTIYELNFGIGLG
ncbi:MAG: patatin-like phospholipase family protein, partial [Anaerolineae bacterium]|nr:patatin-like phospholipase family protein [Anaerolineae bacterium]